jgi:hypothetical protein
MVKLFSTEHTFFHPFDRVTSAFWRKYPNDHAQHVQAIDTWDRHVSPQGFLVSNRIMSCESAIPTWLSSVGLPAQCFVVETSVVDPVSKRMIIKSRNLSGSSLIEVEETCTYAAIKDTQHTQYTQEAKITAFLPFLSGKFEQYSFNNIKMKSKQGMATIETLCQKIQANGVLSLFGDLVNRTSSTPPSTPLSTST